MSDIEGVLTGIPQIPRKTITAELLSITKVAANAQQKSSELDLTNIRDLLLIIHHGRTAVTAFVGAGTEYIVQVSAKASGDDTWTDIASIVAEIALATAITADGAEAAGQTVIEIGANTPAVGDIVFWENATLANSEWGKVVAISAGVTFTLLDGLTNAQAAAQLIYNKGKVYALNLSTRSAKRLRVIVNNANGSTNVQIACRISALTEVL